MSDNHFIGRFRAAAKFETVNMCHVQALLVDNFTFYTLFILFTRISDDLSIWWTKTWYNKHCALFTTSRLLFAAIFSPISCQRSQNVWKSVL